MSLSSGVKLEILESEILNGISNYFQLDQSISILRVVGDGFLHFYQNFNRIF